MQRSRTTALAAAIAVTTIACTPGSDSDRVATLERQVEDLTRENDELRSELAANDDPTDVTEPPPPSTAVTSQPAGAVDPAVGLTDRDLAVQLALQDDKITLWALSDAGLTEVGGTWSDAVSTLDTCALWASDPAAARDLVVTDFATRVYRIVLEHRCPEHLPELEAAAPPPVTVEELNATLGLVAVGWLQDPSRDTYDAVSAVASTLLERPLPAVLSIDPTASPVELVRDLVDYPGSPGAVQEILERLAIGEQYVEQDTGTSSTTSAPAVDADPPSSPPTEVGATVTDTADAEPVTVEELNEVFGPLVEEWVVRPNPETYDAMIASAEQLLMRPLPDDLTDADDVTAAEVFRALMPYPGSDSEVISILDQLTLDVAL